MILPDPVPGLVIRYSYLWKEYGRGQEEGVKDRPCAVILVSVDDGGDRVVTVLPISHTPPANPELAVELPAATKRRLGLDDERSWVVLTDANRFPAQALLAPNPTGEPTLRRKGPGPDLRPARPGDAASVAYGLLPFGLFETIRQQFIAAIRARRARIVAPSTRQLVTQRQDRIGPIPQQRGDGRGVGDDVRIIRAPLSPPLGDQFRQKAKPLPPSGLFQCVLSDFDEDATTPETQDVELTHQLLFSFTAPAAVGTRVQGTQVFL